MQFKIQSAVFHIGSIYDYHFTIRQLVQEFKGQFDCLGENTKKYITFSAPIKKEVVNGKKENDNSKKRKQSRTK